MREVPHPPPRIVWWSLAVVVALLVVLRTGTLFYREYMTSEWAQIQPEREMELMRTIRRLFDDRVASLAHAASSVAHDSLLLADVVSNDPEAILTAYSRLDRISRKTGFDLEVTDPHGTPVAWSGSGGGLRLTSVIDTGVAVHSSGLRSVLSFSARNESAGLLVTAFTPFDVHGAVSERFLPARTFRQDVQQSLGEDVVILGHQETPSGTDERRLRIPLPGASGRVAATVLVDAPTLESELARLDAAVAGWSGLLASLGALLLGALLSFQILRVGSSTVRLILMIALLWLVRFFWLLMDFPSALIGGWIFDPSLYASLFGAGAASSLGELTLSTITVLLSILLVQRERVRKGSRIFFPRSPTLFAVAALVVGIILNIGVRAYGASLRSFVYDSTLRYVQPSEMIPPAPVIIMHLNILALSAAVVILFVAVFGWFFSWYRSNRPSARAAEGFLIVGLLYSISIVVFAAFDRVPQVPWYVPYFLFTAAMVVNAAARNGLGRPLGLGLIVLSAFLVSVPVLDMKIHEKEGDRLRLYANELTQPVDAWLSFVTNESFRSLRQSYADVVLDEPGEKEGNAFLLWTRTLISAEGYNSALVLYDDSGKEIDRFAVGMTTYEQTELLRRLFDVDEDVLNVVERRVPSGLIKYYGLWGSIRDDTDKPIAFAALILSASEQALFRGEAPVPLRPIGTEGVGLSNQTIILSEFQDGRLVASTDIIRQTGPDLPEEVEAALASQKEVTVREQVEDRAFETLYVRDDTRPGRVIAISLEEVGLRWHLFNLVKVALLYASVLGLGLLIVLVIDWRTYRGMLTGFRGRLVLAFLVVAVVPLFLFAYYNREFARERQEVRMTAQLHEDLKLVSQRIVNTVSDEEDFLRGINDDFCEATASEFGVDFTVYRREHVQASSRPELYSAGLIAQRLPGDVFARIVVRGFGYAQTRESIGDLTYEVGYVPLVLHDRLLGVVAVPALFRQGEFESEVAERNAFTLGVYSILVILTAIVGVVLASQLSQPVRDLTKAAHAVGEGDLEVRVEREGSGELKELVRTFNQMVAELKKSREELRRGERERAWKEMAKQVAHEIKNPLTPMRLSIQHLRTAYRDKAPGFDKLIDDVTRTLIDQIDALSRIATEFSSFARMPERRFEKVDVHGLLREALQLFSAMEGVDIRMRFADSGPVLIADREELRRVIINIVRNAVQAMNQHGVITVTTRLHGGTCTIDFTDTGPGIPEELQTKVFEPNFSTKTDGMGLGLAMAQRVVEDLNGTISLKSKPGAGTTVSLTFPIAVGS
ncbi:MAG: histidine kinase [Bacteroidia bacterium]|nr:MAG: histidine kinase [Bacteroidia bacterium]